jgi:hypothetical protein
VRASIPWRSGVVLALSLTLAAGLTACGSTGPSAPASAPSAVAPVSLPASGPTTAPSAASAVPASPAPAASAVPESLAPVEPAASPATGSARPRPSLDAAELAAFLTARITVFDVADADLAVTVSYVDQKSGKVTALGTYPVGALEQLTNAVGAGRYRLDFSLPAGAASGPRCTIDIADKDAVRFVAASADAIAVTRAGTRPKTAADLLVSTSPLCKA